MINDISRKLQDVFHFLSKKSFGFGVNYIQSGASSLAKHGGAYFSAVYGSIQDPIAAPGLFDIQVP